MSYIDTNLKYLPFILPFYQHNIFPHLSTVEVYLIVLQPVYLKYFISLYETEHPSTRTITFLGTINRVNSLPCFARLLPDAV